VLTDRPELGRLLTVLRPGDTLVVWRLDRLGRSTAHLLAVVSELGERGVGFASLTEAIDTATPAGRLMFGVLASLAAFERDLIRERTMAGLAAARARGNVGGRPSTMTAEKWRGTWGYCWQASIAIRIATDDVGGPTYAADTTGWSR
jgi:DNA invertase Pin-like site-specific DNA recombinase